MDKSSEKFSMKKRIKSFRYAIKGLGLLFKQEHNSRIHAVAAILVVILGFVFHVSSPEWCFLIFAIGLVFIAELINSAIENSIDLIMSEPDEKAGNAKDLAAAAVLVSAILAVLIGAIIFIPKILELIKM